jgi:microcystin-dependent protein
MATSRLGLPTPAGTDLITGGDDAITALADVLDDAAIYAHGSFAGRPAAAALAGKFYLADDVAILYLSNGTSWLEVSRGAADVPIGAMLDYAGGSDPSDTRFILADGRAISRSTYAAAFAIMGTTHGAGDGSTTFNVPDLRGRSTVGPDDMGTAAGAASRLASNNTRGAVGGAELRALITGNLPSHTHDAGSLATDTVAAHSHAAGTLVTSAVSAGTPAGTMGSQTFAPHALGNRQCRDDRPHARGNDCRALGGALSHGQCDCRD